MNKAGGKLLRPRSNNVKHIYLRLILAVSFVIVIPYFSPKVKVRTKWYNEDLETVFGIPYLPRSIDDPANNSLVSQILDTHDVRTDNNYKDYEAKSFSTWNRREHDVAAGPSPSENRMYIANAGGKGHGLFAARVLKAGEFLAEYTGIYVLGEEGQNTDYMWDYESMPLDNNGNNIRISYNFNFKRVRP
jgi:hypothetical protein